MIPGCLIIKFTITQNARYGNHFHDVLCLSEAKGMDINMGRHGENIRQRRDGRWEARYMVYDENKTKKVCRSVYGYTYEEAKTKRVAAVIMSENPFGKTDTSDWKCRLHQDMLFETAAQEWFAIIKSKQKPSTYEKYCIIYHCYLETALGKTALDQITENLVREKLSCEDSSDSVKKSIYCVLNRILKYASGQYSVTLPDIKKPTPYTCKKTVEVFTKAEQTKLFSAVYHEMDIFKLAVLLCLFTGLRLGELCALQWSDIDFENKTLFVKRTVQRLYVGGRNTKTTLVETEPKSVRSKREIPLQDIIIALLFDFMDGKKYVFGGDKPMEPRTMRNHYRKILEVAEVSYKNFHTLRHTYATNCIDGGADVKSLSEMLGHSNVQITMDYYVHPSMDTKRRYADRLCDFYARIYGQIHGKVD